MYLLAQHRSGGLHRRGLALFSAAIVAALTMAIAAPASNATGVVAWGTNDDGPLGNGTITGSTVPVGVSGLSEVAAVSVGNENSLALMENGSVMSWGWNAYGQLGIGSFSGPENCRTGPCSKTPVAVSGLSGVTAITTGLDHDMALLSGGTVMAWGYNAYGQLGDGSTTSTNLPGAVSNLSGVTAISAHEVHSLALLNDGTVMAWGGNGIGPDTCFNGAPCSKIPRVVAGLSGVTAIATGDGHNLALLSDGTVKAWGLNAHGQLGNGSTIASEVPVAVSGLSGVTAISAGGSTSMALLSDGTVRAWGYGGSGNLGNGATLDSDVPVAVSGLSGVTVIATGGSTSMARLSDGALMSWGTVLGNGTPGSSDEPVPVGGLTDATAMAGGNGVDLAIATPPSPPEFGRCLRVTSGAYATSACASTPTGGRFNWIPGVAKTGFTTKGGGSIFETVGTSKEKTKVLCKTQAGQGHYEGTRDVKSVVMTFTGCESLAQKCTSRGAAEGEIVTNTLEGHLGWWQKTTELKTTKVALDLAPEENNGLVARFECGTTPIEVRGSVIAGVKKDATLVTSPLAVAQLAGKQQPEHFEGAPNDVLEAAVGGKPFRQMGLRIKELKQTSEEAVEINAFV
jgi:alpha-tubulin suppressor-like RCC1 family protein